MAKPETLRKIENEIAAGKLGIARDRLHGLVAAYPEDLSLRIRLGEVYWRLGYPVLAGQFWFLEENLSEEQREAVSHFIADCREDSLAILKRLRLRIPVEEISNKVAKEKLIRLEEECRGQGKEPPSFDRRQSASCRQDRLLLIGCALIAFALLFLLVVGMSTVVQWITGSH